MPAAKIGVIGGTGYTVIGKIKTGERPLPLSRRGHQTTARRLTILTYTMYNMFVKYVNEVKATSEQSYGFY